MWKAIKSDYEVKYKNRLSLFKFIYTYMYDYNFRVVVRYRVQKKCSSKNKIFRTLALIIRNRSIRKYGVEIGINTSIGNGFLIAHLNGIVIGDGTMIGENFTIFQQVTLGQKNNKYPILKDNVTIYPGAKLIGGISIESHSIIGANAIVVQDVGMNEIYVGPSAKLITSYNERGTK
ncbi:serine acetyltransferase [Carnobacterium maltaromaticum]|uniref:serine O-acetyltransferase n=1 Tax=Carnobacterium maltaromaticum TaxID=2751 RepID=UPI00295EC206|nr:serine acetyltransferase [Carnobacterium maltaromaticum]